MSLDESRFHAIADKTIGGLADLIDTDMGDAIDVEIQDGILTIGLPGGGQYVVNKNAPLRQIWLSSPKSGAWHFDWDDGDELWRSTRGVPTSLAALLADELEAVTGKRIDL